MSRIKDAYKLAESHAKELGYKGVLDGILHGTEEHRAAIRAVNRNHLIKTKRSRYRSPLVEAK